MKNVLVCGAGGFIGGHLVKRLKSDGYYVRGVDIKKHEYSKTLVDDFIVGDLCYDDIAIKALEGIDIVFQLAADMGGAGYIFTGNNDANVMYNSCKINLNVLEFGVKAGVKKFFYSSSACAYPEFNQTDPNNPNCSEDSVYILHNPIVNMDGKSFLAKDYFLLIRAIMASMYILLDFTIFLALRVLGMEVVKKLLLQCVEK